MKQNGKKGLSLPMEIIIGVVVLVVIALAVIMFTSGSITKTGTQTAQTQAATSNQIRCNSEAISYCNSNAATVTECDLTNCPSCLTAVDCTTVRSTDATTSGGAGGAGSCPVGDTCVGGTCQLAGTPC